MDYMPYEMHSYIFRQHIVTGIGIFGVLLHNHLGLLGRRLIGLGIYRFGVKLSITTKCLDPEFPAKIALGNCWLSIYTNLGVKMRLVNFDYWLRNFDIRCDKGLHLVFRGLVVGALWFGLSNKRNMINMKMTSSIFSSLTIALLFYLFFLFKYKWKILNSRLVIYALYHSINSFFHNVILPHTCPT